MDIIFKYKGKIIIKGLHENEKSFAIVQLCSHTIVQDTFFVPWVLVINSAGTK